MNERHELSAQYFGQKGAGRLSSEDITDRLMEEFVEKRERLRQNDGGGGLSTYICDILGSIYGGQSEKVAVLDDKGQVIQGLHTVYVLSDGGILDISADQFGETAGIVVVHPDDPMMARYRPDFDAEDNPWNSREFEGWHHLWNGFPDPEQARHNTREKGDGWWLDDTSMLCDFLEKQLEYANNCPDEKYGRRKAETFEKRLEGLKMENAPRM